MREETVWITEREGIENSEIDRVSAEAVNNWSIRFFDCKSDEIVSWFHNELSKDETFLDGDLQGHKVVIPRHIMDQLWKCLVSSILNEFHLTLQEAIELIVFSYMQNDKTVV